MLIFLNCFLVFFWENLGKNLRKVLENLFNEIVLLLFLLKCLKIFFRDIFIIVYIWFILIFLRFVGNMIYYVFVFIGF